VFSGCCRIVRGNLVSVFRPMQATGIIVDENRLIDIESKLAHQEHMLAELNTALTNQQTQLTLLEDLCESLVERVRSLSDAGPAGDPADEQPPHY
jgi:SlyX protein